MSPVAWVAVARAALLLVSVLVMYNRFVRQRTLVDESWGGIDVELTRRHDLIPQLVETVRGYAAHEQALLDPPGRGPRDRERPPRRVPRPPAGVRGLAGRRAPDAARPRRGLPGPQGEPELPGAPAGADRHRGPDRGQPALLQRQRARLQHPGPHLPQQPGRGRVPVPAAGVLRAATRGRLTPWLNLQRPRPSSWSAAAWPPAPWSPSCARAGTTARSRSTPTRPTRRTNVLRSPRTSCSTRVRWRTPWCTPRTGTPSTASTCTPRRRSPPSTRPATRSPRPATTRRTRPWSWPPARGPGTSRSPTTAAPRCTTSASGTTPSGCARP